MKKTYLSLIQQKYKFPQNHFTFKDDYLSFHGIPLKALIEKHGSPLKFYYLPKIREQINNAKINFEQAIEKHDYTGMYYYCYCTKCCHYSHVVETAISAGAHLETSSALDIDLILKLYSKNKIDQSRALIHNGLKSNDYLAKILDLNKMGFNQSITVLDSKKEFERLSKLITQNRTKIKLGIRLAISEPSNSSYPASRFGISKNEVLPFYKKQIAPYKNVDLKMLHFFIDSGIKDNDYYWNEFDEILAVYADLKKTCNTLNAINIGGGFPIQNTLDFSFDYEKIIDKMIKRIKAFCSSHHISEPDLYSEFGKYTVGESGALIFSILEQKEKMNAPCWYLMDNSLMNTIPDAWSNYDQFILLPINKWQNEYHPVSIGGLSCDHSDFHNKGMDKEQLQLPKFSDQDDEPLYISFFHTGAYQDALSAYGGVKHCLIPSPKQIIIDRNEKDELEYRVFGEDQIPDDALKILGF